MQENLEQISETFLRDSIEKWSDDPTISEDKRREIVLTFNQANLIAKGYRLVCSAENEKELKEKEKPRVVLFDAARGCESHIGGVYSGRQRSLGSRGSGGLRSSLGSAKGEIPMYPRSSGGIDSLCFGHPFGSISSL